MTSCWSVSENLILTTTGVVYDGEVETNDLEELFANSTLKHPPGYEGHSLSCRTWVELYDDSGSSFTMSTASDLRKYPSGRRSRSSIRDRR
jgi:hypothetical protein